MVEGGKGKEEEKEKEKEKERKGKERYLGQQLRFLLESFFLPFLLFYNTSHIKKEVHFRS